MMDWTCPGCGLATDPEHLDRVHPGITFTTPKVDDVPDEVKAVSEIRKQNGVFVVREARRDYL